MKTTILSLACLFALQGLAFAGYDNNGIDESLNLSPACSKAIAKKLAARCDKDSKGDDGRIHDCWETNENEAAPPSLNDEDSAVFDYVFIVGDADEYAYKVAISSKSKCEFTASAEQQ